MLGGPRLPPGYRRTPPVRCPKLDDFTEIIDQILRDDQHRPKKQRHTAKRICERLRAEHAFRGGYTIVQDSVRAKRLGGQEMFVPLVHRPGDAQADFGGVPRGIVYDNTKLAVARILGDGTRQRTQVFSELQSHYLFDDRFGRPGKGNDKGKVEGLVGYARRKPLSKTGAELLFEIFSQRYEQASTLVTSNLPFNEWTEIFGSERLTGALLDRLTHHVHILELNGDSYRLAHSKHARHAAAAPAA